MNPEHGEWFEKAGLIQAAGINGFETQLFDELENRLLFLTVTSDEHHRLESGAKTGVIHQVCADLVHPLEYLRAFGPLRHLFRAGSRITAIQATEVLLQRVCGVDHDLA